MRIGWRASNQPPTSPSYIGFSEFFPEAQRLSSFPKHFRHTIPNHVYKLLSSSWKLPSPANSVSIPILANVVSIPFLPNSVSIPFFPPVLPPFPASSSVLLSSLQASNAAELKTICIARAHTQWKHNVESCTDHFSSAPNDVGSGSKFLLTHSNSTIRLQSYLRSDSPPIARARARLRSCRARTPHFLAFQPKGQRFTASNSHMHCTACDTQDIADTSHLLLDCPRFIHARLRLSALLSSLPSAFHTLTVALMLGVIPPNTKPKIVSNFLSYTAAFFSYFLPIYPL